MKVRKKSPVLEAVKWDGTDEALEKIRAMDVEAEKTEDGYLYIYRRDREPGIWVLQDVEGNVHTLSPEAFNRQYEIIEPEPEQLPDWHLRAKVFWEEGETIRAIYCVGENMELDLDEARAYCEKHFGKP